MTAPALPVVPTASRSRRAPRVAIVVYDDDQQQLSLRRHILLAAQQQAGDALGLYADCEVVDCGTRAEVLTLVEHLDHSLLFIDLESRTGQLRGARLLRTIAETPHLAARSTSVAMTAHNSFTVLVGLKYAVAGVLQTTGEDLGHDAREALLHVAAPETRSRRRAFPRALTASEVRGGVRLRFIEHFGFEPRTGDVHIVANLAQGVSDSVTNRELKEIDGARSAVAHFKRAVKDARGVPIDLVVPLAQSYLAGCVRETLDEPTRAGTLDLATATLADRQALDLARISDDDVALVRRCGRVWHHAQTQLDPRDQAGRQVRVERVIEATCPDETERERLRFLVHLLADLAHEPAPEASAAMHRIVAAAHAA